MTIPVVIQYRHVHLSEKDKEALFGSKTLEIDMSLNHRGQVVYKESVSIVSKKGVIEHVKILGPMRDQTQVELSSSEATILGIKAPLRHSGDLSRVGSCVIKNGDVEVKVSSCVIVPAMHLHLSEHAAQELQLENHSSVSLKLVDRPYVVFEPVFVRVHPTFSTEFHLSSDEASEIWIQPTDEVVLC